MAPLDDSTAAEVPADAALLPVEEDGGEESPYLLHSPIDITAVLRDIVRTRALASVHFGANQETLLTSLLRVDPRAGEIVFDCSGSERLNAALLRAGTLLFVSAHDKVKVRFTTGPAQAVQHGGATAFSVRMPDSMLRLQRREFFRVLAPIARPVRCYIPVEHAGGTKQIESRLHDISMGGVAVVTQPGEMPAQLGTHYAPCRIVLPDAGSVIVTLQAMNLCSLALLNGKSALRVGCQFVRPAMTALNLIHRYIMRVESEKRARD